MTLILTIISLITIMCAGIEHSRKPPGRSSVFACKKRFHETKLRFYRVLLNNVNIKSTYFIHLIGDIQDSILNEPTLDNSRYAPSIHSFFSLFCGQYRLRILRPLKDDIYYLFCTFTLLAYVLQRIPTQYTSISI